MDYTLKNPEKGLLNGEDLHFFYYDVLNKNEDSLNSLFEWNNDIVSYLDKHGVRIEVCEIEQMPHEYPNDKLLFSMYNNKETKPQAFLRHLRNAFVHINIQRDDEYYLLKDRNGKGLTTMIGRVKCTCLKEVCFLLFKQEERELDNFFE